MDIYIYIVRLFLFSLTCILYIYILIKKKRGTNRRTTIRTHNFRTRRCDGSRGFPSIKSHPQTAVGGIRTPAHVVNTKDANHWAKSWTHVYIINFYNLPRKVHTAPIIKSYVIFVWYYYILFGGYCKVKKYTVSVAGKVRDHFKFQKPRLFRRSYEAN